MGTGSLTDLQIQRLGDLGWSRTEETRPITFRCVPAESELADAKHLPLSQIFGHAPSGIGEDPQLEQFSSHPFRLLGSATIRDTEQHQQARTDLGDGGSSNPDSGRADPLDDCPQTFFFR